MTLHNRLEQMGISPSALDSMIHDTANALATNANNEGLSGQIRFLEKSGFSEQQIWASILIDQLESGIEVDVSDPLHSDSSHTCSFSGTVVKVNNDCVCVRDMEDQCWDVRFDEIEKFGM